MINDLKRSLSHYPILKIKFFSLGREIVYINIFFFLPESFSTIKIAVPQIMNRVTFIQMSLRVFLIPKLGRSANASDAF